MNTPVERSLDPAILRQWVGRSLTVEDEITPGPARRMAATLDRGDDWVHPGAALPHLWHWIYFLTAAPRSELGRDGHPRLGGFLPPVALPRRMWAGSRVRFVQPLRIGDRARLTSTIMDVQPKTGRSGSLCFVTVRHEVLVGGQPRIVDEQDIVYREDPTPGQAPPPPRAAPADADMVETFPADPVLLFRYSALTFNGHRIHYDRDYARDVEGYRGLVVHGPLLATLLVDLAGRLMAGAPIVTFSFRGLSPVFDVAPFAVAGRREGEGAAVWIAGPDGALAMSGSAE